MSREEDCSHIKQTIIFFLFVILILKVLTKTQRERLPTLAQKKKKKSVTSEQATRNPCSYILFLLRSLANQHFVIYVFPVLHREDSKTYQPPSYDTSLTIRLQLLPKSRSA